MAAFISEANLITYIETVINFQTSIDNFWGLSYDSLGDVDDLCSQHIRLGCWSQFSLLLLKNIPKKVWTLYADLHYFCTTKYVVIMTTFSHWILVFLDAQKRSSWTFMDPV